MKHTPGPWAIENIDNVNPDLSIYSVSDLVNGNSNKQINICECNWRRSSIDKDRANAKLIASAPELLEALQYLIKELPTDTWDYSPDCFVIATNAIKKATE